jgi:PmbA protein
VSALEVARAALAAAGGEAEAVAHTERSGLARFADSEVHQPTLIENTVVSLRVVKGTRVGVASTNKVDGDGLAEVARRAADAAESAPEDESFPGLASPAEPPEVDGYDDATAALGPDDQARLAAAAIDAAEVPVYGFFTSAVSELAIASTTGVSVEQRMTDASTLVVAADEGRSGFAEQTAWRAADLDPAAVAREASEKAVRTKDATEIEPGTYRAVLEPYAFADLLDSFSHDAFGGLGLIEERSYLSGRLGQKVFDEKVSIADDSLDPRGLPKAFDFEGTPKQRVQLVEGGVARGVVWDRETVEERQAVDRPRAPARLPGLGAAAVRALGRAGRGSFGRRARGADRRRPLHHAAPLPRRRASAGGRDHRDDARRHVPDQGRQDRRARREPPLHRRRSGIPQRDLRAHAHGGARQLAELLRRALSLRRAGARSRGGALHDQRRRLEARDLTTA